MSNTADVEDALWSLVEALPGLTAASSGYDPNNLPSVDGLYIVDLKNGDNQSGAPGGDGVMTENYTVTVWFLQFVNPNQFRATKRNALSRKDGIRNALCAVPALDTVDASCAYKRFNIDDEYAENHWLVQVEFIVTHTQAYE